jgi:endonuclease/exonuclease/phosphatase family metal-dependent hydrolase
MTVTTKFQQPNPELETRKEKPGFFRVVTYNIHKGRGMDRRNRIQRVAEILQCLKPDREEMRYGWKKNNR